MILHIESATRNCSVALANKGELIGVKELNEGSFSHSEKLHAFIDELMLEASIEMKDLSAVAVSKGPGSYTGLRIGVSAAKGICYSMGIPLLAVPTLESLAHQLHPEKGSYIIPMIDARRMEVFNAIYNSDLELVTPTQATVLDETSFADLFDKAPVYLIGDGADKCIDLFKHENARIIQGKSPSSKEMVPLAYELFKNSKFEDVAYFEPYYLKDFVAGKPKKPLL